MNRYSSNGSPRQSLDQLVRAHIAAARGKPRSVRGRAITVFTWSAAATEPWQWAIARRLRAERMRAERTGAES